MGIWHQQSMVEKSYETDPSFKSGIKKKYNGAMLRCTMKMMNENCEMACDNAVNMISRILTKGISEFQR